jgi:hypothetical protein
MFFEQYENEPYVAPMGPGTIGSQEPATPLPISRSVPTRMPRAKAASAALAILGSVPG